MPFILMRENQDVVSYRNYRLRASYERLPVQSIGSWPCYQRRQHASRLAAIVPSSTRRQSQPAWSLQDPSHLQDRAAQIWGRESMSLIRPTAFHFGCGCMPSPWYLRSRHSQLSLPAVDQLISHLSLVGHLILRGLGRLDQID